MPNTAKTPLQIAKVLKFKQSGENSPNLVTLSAVQNMNPANFKLVQVTIRLPVLLSFCLLKHFSFEANEFSNRFENLNRFSRQENVIFTKSEKILFCENRFRERSLKEKTLKIFAQNYYF